MNIYLLITIIAGICSGIWIHRRIHSQIMLVYYHRKYKSEESYIDVYNLLDEVFNFELMKDSKYAAQDYAEFLLRHQSARDYAYGYFVDVIQGYNKEIKKYIVGILIISLFFSVYLYVFIVINLIIIIAFALHEKYVQKRGEYFYIQLMLLIIFSMYNASDHLVFRRIEDSIIIPNELKENKTFQNILDIELGFWRMPAGGGHVRRHFSPKGIFIMPSPDGEWVYLDKKGYLESAREDGLAEIFHKVKGIKFTEISRDLAVLSYGITAIYETGRDYRVLACSTYKKNKNGSWQQLIHQQGYAKF